MGRVETATRSVLLALVALLPFEFNTRLYGLSSLQVVFILVALVATPILLRDWKPLLTDRLVLVMLGLVVVFWISALMAPDHFDNAVRGAIRVTCGWFLLCVALRIAMRDRIERVWCWSAVAASVYALADYFGLGFHSLFRTESFYSGDLLRLSGSFEYPNTAATFFAMSLPFVWMRSRVATLPLWAALVLTYSRGALAGLLLVLVAAFLFKRDKTWLQLAGVGIVFAVVLYGGRVVVAHAQGEGWGAQYTLKFNHLRAAPGAVGTMPVTLRNSGTAPWEDVVLSYHWYDTERKRLVFVPERATALPALIEPGHGTTVQAALQTPPEPGIYLLDWDLKSGDRWFSIAGGVLPAIVEVAVEPGASFDLQRGDVTRWYRVGPGRMLDASVQRLQLWSAAWTMIRKHPLMGTGPDSFRLLYGAALGYARWDVNIRANSLYLELLTGCGIVGLLAFAASMASIRWTMQPAALAVAVFLAHGVVDSFLMTTPIYFGFWLLVGMVHADRV